MNIEKSLDIVKGKLLMIDKILKQDQEEGHGSAYEMQKEDFEAIETLLTAYEQKCNYIKENEIYKKNLFDNYEEKCKELEKEKEKDKEYKDMIIRHKKQLKQGGIYGYDYDLEILEEE